MKQLLFSLLLLFVLEGLPALSDERLRDEANTLLKAGKTQEGYQKLKEYVKTEEKPHYSSYALLAYIALGLRNFEEARVFASKAVELKPTDASSLYVLGVITQADGDFNEAIEFYDEVIRNGDRTDRAYGSMYVRSLLQLGVCYTGKDDLEKANSYYKQVLAVESWHELANAYYGTNLIRQEKWKEALEPLSKAYQKNPERIEALGMFAMALFQTGQYTAAARNFERLIKLEPNQPTHYLNMGRSLVMRGNHDQAVPYFDKGIKMYRDKGQEEKLLNFCGEAIVAYLAVKRENDAVEIFNLLRKLDEAQANQVRKELIKQWPHLEEKLRQQESLAPIQGPVFAKEEN